jgi:CBS domain-containing protein
MTCKDVMTADPKYCLPGDSVTLAARIMREENVGPVPVISDRKHKRLAGMVTDRDLAIKVVASGRDPESMRVRDVMTTDVVTCKASDDYQKALDAMARHQVRRIPVIDRSGALAGIISQADVARKSSETDVGEVVERISEPEGFGKTLGRMFSTPARARRQHRAYSNSTPLAASAVGFGIGAVLAYLLDPDRGRTRRAKIRDRAAGLYGDAGSYAGKIQRDVRNRTSGLAAAAKSKVTGREPVWDERLVARVRSKIGRAVSHPHAIQVSAENGRITLHGPVLADEADDLVACVRSVAGVTGVDNYLETHEQAEGVPALQGGPARRGSRSEFMQTSWSPAARFAATAIGGGIALYGLKSKGAIAKAAATVGLGLAARGVTNKEVTKWTGFGDRRALRL